MWRPLWPGRPAADIPISHVTNGVHATSWMAGAMQQLLNRHLGPEWRPSRRFLDVGGHRPHSDASCGRCAPVAARPGQLIRERSIHDRLSRGEPQKASTRRPRSSI
jgi:hypothetical protein